MMTAADSTHHLARQVRERFVKTLDDGIDDLEIKTEMALSELMGGGAKMASMEEIRLTAETARKFQLERRHWTEAVRQAWRECGRARGGGDGKAKGGGKLSFELEDEAVSERKILASRLTSAVNEAAGEEINNLKLRIQSLERTTDLASQDVLRPETLAAVLVKAWADCGLTRPMWNLAQPAIQSALAEKMAEAYQAANKYLIDHGVMPEIDLRALVKREGQQGGGAAGPGQAMAEPLAASHARLDSRLAEYARQNPATEMHARPSMLARAAQETRMMTGMTPMARIRERAQGVLGQLRRLLTNQVVGYDAGATTPAAPSPQLAEALAAQAVSYAATELMTGAGAAMSVQAVAADLRKRATELKAKADKPSEKAIIEIVALMFQAILAEERIPSSIRVWFARLQIPVLRLALAEPDFFASVQHPARQLIDRMGACALGFDTTQAGSNGLEHEIKRIVQVIEQYPETGRRVFQLVLDEFKKFLGRSLTKGGTVQQAATLAQKVEQKEALSIQYTIELRRMLTPVPVSDDVREFLFRLWSDVLAMAAVRHGPQGEETLRFKQAAADLVWSVCPRTDRAERSRVVQKLADLLAVLREGMATLAISERDQDGHLKLLNNAVMQAFVSRAAAISQATLEDLARGLAGLEDVITDDPQGDVLLDPNMIEMMFGIGAGALEVIAVGGSQPNEGMLQWARELELGAWFSLEQQGVVTKVQYVWHSARGQLHLLASSAGKNYLVQTRRLAAYLQAGLLVPVEDEALTVRATRQALAKLNATPDQLLH